MEAKRKSIYSIEQIETIKHLYENSILTYVEISNDTGISKNTIQGWARKYNWTKLEQYKEGYNLKRHQVNEKITKTDPDVILIRQLYENTDLSIPEIAKKLNTTKDKVWLRIKKFNLIRNRELQLQCRSRICKENYNKHNITKLNNTKLTISRKNKEIWKNRSVEVKRKIIDRRIQTIKKKTLEERNNTRQKISLGVKNNWNKKTEEYKLQLRKKLSYIQQNLPEETRKQKIIRDHQTKHKNNSFRKAIALDGKSFDSSYETYVYNFCKRNNIQVKTQIPIEYNYNNKKHITYIDFEIDGILFECKGGHLLKGVYDYQGVPIKTKLDVYKHNNVVVITDTLGSNVIPKPNSNLSNGLKYSNKCQYPLIGVDINLFREPLIPYAKDKPKCFYDVRVDNRKSVSEAWKDEKLRWEMIKNRIMYTGGYIDNRQVLTAMNVTRNCKQPSWFSKQYAKDIISKYITSNIIVDPFAGWGARCDACKDLSKVYIGCDLNKELVEWHQSLGRNITLGDANSFKFNEVCSVLICPPYTDFETYFEGQDLKTTQCQWLEIVRKNVPNANEYVMVCKVVDPGYEQYIVEEKINKSHFGINKEYVIRIPNKK